MPLQDKPESATAAKAAKPSLTGPGTMAKKLKDAGYGLPGGQTPPGQAPTRPPAPLQTPGLGPNPTDEWMRRYRFAPAPTSPLPQPDPSEEIFRRYMFTQRPKGTKPTPFQSRPGFNRMQIPGGGPQAPSADPRKSSGGPIAVPRG